jgi:hypothetical protein
MSKLQEARDELGGANDRTFCIPVSRVSIDWLEKYCMQRMPHQFCLHNLAYSDFYLFLTMKEKLERIRVADEDQFLSHCKRF